MIGRRRGQGGRRGRRGWEGEREGEEGQDCSKQFGSGTAILTHLYSPLLALVSGVCAA